MSHYFLIMSPCDDYQLSEADMPIQKNGLSEKKFWKGARLSSNEVQEPVIIDLYYPEDVMAEMFKSPLLIRDDLLSDIQNFGVTNLDIYDCNLVDNESGKVWQTYKLVNIIGLIDVFDMGASELHPDSPPDVAYLFNKIVIDEKKAKGHHFFRPYGRMTQILVSEELKTHLETTGKYKHLQFVPPEDFA